MADFPQQSIGKAQTRLYRDLISAGDHAVSETLSVSNTSQVITLGIAAKMITLQPSGSLACTYTVSANGENFATGGTLSANGLSSYNTNMVKVITLTWTSGSGTVTILAGG